MAAIREALTRQHRLPRALRRTLLVVGLGIFGLIAVGWIAYSLLAAKAIGDLQRELLSLPLPSSKILVCRTGPSAACAEKAARRMEVTFAWMPTPSGYRLRSVVAAAFPTIPVDRRFGSEDLISDQFWITLYTQPDRPWYDQKLIGTSLIQGTQVEVLAPRNPELFHSLRLLWTHLGMTYSLDVNRASFFDSTPLHAKDFLPLIRTVRYADPPSA